MATPSFEFLKRISKPGGITERIEVSPLGVVIKKYRMPDGTTYSSVQNPHQSRSDFLKSLNEDKFEGFRKLL